ncbi:hypothetical protein D3C80_1297190 [compost metagenome]
MSKIPAISTANKAMNLFVWRRNPNCVYTQVSKVAFIQLLCKPFQIATVECTDIFAGSISCWSTVGIVIAGIPILEAVC